MKNKQSIWVKIFVTTLILQGTSFVQAQNKSFTRTLKSQTYFYSMHVGSTGLLGDLGGGYENGKSGPWDLNLESTRYMIGGAIHLNPNNKHSAAFHLNHLLLYANDRYSKNESRRFRNLNVATRVFEANTIVYKRLYHETNRDYQSLIKIGTGCGLFWFNPTANYDGKRYSLAQLNTEGQNFRPELKDYAQFSVSVPIYLTFNKSYYNGYSFGVELGVRKLFTDYIDDVSTTYAGFNELQENNGTLSANIADANLSNTPYTTGTKRGNENNNDSYFHLAFTVSKRLDKKTK